MPVKFANLKRNQTKESSLIIYINICISMHTFFYQFVLNQKSCICFLILVTVITAPVIGKRAAIKVVNTSLCVWFRCGVNTLTGWATWQKQKSQTFNFRNSYASLPLLVKGLHAWKVVNLSVWFRCGVNMETKWATWHNQRIARRPCTVWTNSSPML